mgnify:CR=1 FL=1
MVINSQFKLITMLNNHWACIFDSERKLERGGHSKDWESIFPVFLLLGFIDWSTIKDNLLLSRHIGNKHFQNMLVPINLELPNKTFFGPVDKSDIFASWMFILFHVFTHILNSKIHSSDFHFRFLKALIIINNN